MVRESGVPFISYFGRPRESADMFIEHCSRMSHGS